MYCQLSSHNSHALPSHLNVLHWRRSSVSIHPPKGRCAGILRTRSSCRPIQSKVKSLTNAEHICLSERLVWSRLTSDFGHTAEMHTPWISPQESLSCWPFNSAIGPRFFAPARFCGPWKDAGKPTRTQTNRTGIKRARVHMPVCWWSNLLLGLDAFEVADPAPSQNPCLLAKGWEVGSFLLL